MNREKVLKIINDSTDLGGKEFKPSIRAVYVADNNGDLSHLGSCVLLSINQENYLLTAAHIVDKAQKATLYINGTANELVCINGLFMITNKPELGRDADHYDFAWLHLSDKLIELCGKDDFITEERLIEGAESSEGIIYLALGYPCSKNEPNRFKKTISPNYFRYADMVKSDKKLCQKLGISGADHLFLNYNFKHSKNERGFLINAIKPQGLSGGALVDMGTIADWNKPGFKAVGKLAGLIIEGHKDHKVVVAVKMNNIVNSIKQKQTKDAKRNSGI